MKDCLRAVDPSCPIPRSVRRPERFARRCTDPQRIVRRATLVAGFVVAWLACGGRTATSLSSEDDRTPQPATTDGRVVLVTIDGARWQDVFGGSDPAIGGAPATGPEQVMPRTHELVATRGVALGADLPGCATVHTAGGSNVSLPGYTEIFTGRPSQCLDNKCERVGRTVLDEASSAGIGGVASIGSWRPLERAVSGGGAGVFVAEGRPWPRTAPTSSSTFDELVATGDHADPMPGHGDYRPDEATAAIALEYFRREAPAFFHVGLGDTDEWAHRGDYRAYLAALLRADTLIGELADVIDKMGERGEATTVIVTPDHGRASNFIDHSMFRTESGRTFLLAFGRHVPVRGVACPRRDITLADIAPTIRVLLGLPSDTHKDAGRPIELLLPMAANP